MAAALALCLAGWIAGVAPARAQASGTKILYLHDDQTLTRTPQAGDTMTPVTIGDEGLSADWQMTPAIPAGKSLTLTAGDATAVLDIAATGDQTGNARPVTVELRSSSGLIASDTFNVTNANDQYTATLPVASDTTLAAGDYLVLRIYNNEDAPANRERSIAVSQKTAADGPSTLSFDTSTVVNVDSVVAYSAAWPAMTTQPLYDDGETVYLRAVVSDPFGGADVSGATLALTDAAAALQFSGVAMTLVDSDAASKTYEYAYTLQAGSADGVWTADVTASEGSEGTITHSASGGFSVGVPVLAIAKSHSGSFTAGGNGTYDIVVHNNGSALTGTTTVTDTLDGSLSYVSGGGTGWSCGAAGQLVTCTNAASLAGGADLPVLSLVVAVAGSAGSTIANHAAVAHPSVNGGTPQDGNTDVATVLHPILSEGSSKSVVDLDGGDADPGDTLRYTITLAETGGVAAANVAVTDDIPANVSGFSVVSVPGGSTDGSTGGGTGANGTGYLDVTGITVPANGSVTIVFDVTVAGGAQPGDAIDNTAAIDNPNGSDSTVTAPTVTVSQSQAAGSGNKVLYAYDDQTLTRTPQAADSVAPVDIAGALDSADWTMTPDVAAGKSLVLSAGDITASLVMAATNNNLASARPVSVELRTSSGTIATSANVNVSGATQAIYSFTISVPQTTINAGDHLVMRVRNELPGNAGRHVAVYQRVAGTGASTLSFDTSTVVNVDSVAIYSAAYPATTTQAVYQQGDTVYVRAVVSDPFGSADAGSATLSMTDVNGATRLSDASMTQVADSGVADRTFEYAYQLPGDAAVGFWTASATGHEGTEGTVSHTANMAFGVGVSTLSVAKSHTGTFAAGGNATWTIVAHNNSPGDVAGTTTVTDTLDTSLSYVSGTGTGWTCGAAGQLVTCTSTDTITAGGDLPAITLVATVAGGAGTSVDNIASVANSSVDGGDAQPGNIDSATIVHPILSEGSSKSVVDLDGGDADPGDTLRYTITLAETGGVAAANVAVTDDIPANVGGFSMVSVPAGSTDASTGSGTGANGTGHVDVTGITVPANGSVTIVFDVTVAGGAQPGDAIDNTAAIDNPNGSDSTVTAPTVTVSQSQAAGSGNKVLYAYDDQTLTRTPQAANSTTPVEINGSASADWQMTPVVAAGKSLVLTAGDISVTLVMATANQQLGTSRPVTVELRSSSGTIATSAPVNVSGGTTAAYTFTVTVPQTTINAGDALVMRVANGSGTVGRHVAVSQKTAANGASKVAFATSTVVNVDSVAVYSAAYPATTTRPSYVHGQVAYVRAVVSDPFGSGDVSGANLTLTDSSPATKLSNAVMTQVADSGAATRTFEYGYVVPTGARLGNWTASVTGKEGSEGTVTHTANGSFAVAGKVTLGKAWSGADAGDAVDLAITGGADAVAGSSTAPSTTTPATATAGASASIGLSESFTTGDAGSYSPSLACTRNADGVALSITGSGLSRTITMPIDSSVTCTWTNTKTVPVTVVKLSTVHSDPINGLSHPKAIPGALVEYTLVFTNPGATPIDGGSLYIRDPLPAQVAVRVADIGAPGSGPVSFIDGSPPSGLSYTFTSLGSATDDVDFSDDHGATWTYAPTPDVNGTDAAVTGVRINPKGSFNTGNAQFTLKFRVRIK